MDTNGNILRRIITLKYYIFTYSYHGPWIGVYQYNILEPRSSAHISRSRALQKNGDGIPPIAIQHYSIIIIQIRIADSEYKDQKHLKKTNIVDSEYLHNIYSSRLYRNAPTKCNLYFVC